MPLQTEAACSTPMYAANADSNSPTKRPREEIHDESMHSLT